MADFDSVLFISFGGPERPDDILPFLRNVTTGRDVPEDRLMKVAEQYHEIGGRSPINDQTRALMAAVTEQLVSDGVDLPVYWGNRNWDPFLTDTLAQMKADGCANAVGFVTSAYSSYSGCRQYREDVEKAQGVVGAGAPAVKKIGQFYDNAGFIDPFVRATKTALRSFEAESDVRLVFTAHSVPSSMAQHCRYEAQLDYTASAVTNAFDNRYRGDLVYQSRSGSPHTPWLEPDVNDHLRNLADQGVRDVVIVPIGFICDHVEVMYDLDNQARRTADSLSINMVRASTPGTDAQFVRMVTDLIIDEVKGTNTNRCLGAGCCLAH